MRLLILTQYYPPEVGAAQLRLFAISRELVRNGHEVQVVTAHPNYPAGRLDPADRWRPVRRGKHEEIPVTRMWMYPATGTGTRRLASYLSFAATGLFGGLLARAPDVVLVESPPLFLGITGWMLSRRFGAPMVLIVSDLWPDSVHDIGAIDDGPMLRAAMRLERWIYRRSSAVTAVTMGIRRRLIEEKEVPASRVLTLTNGIDTDVFRPDGSGNATARPAILYTGNHGLAQGLDVLLGAAALTPEIDWVLIGDGSDKQRLERDAERFGLRNVRFEAPIPADAIAGRYGAAIAGVASLRASDLMNDARPAKLLAIMACGRPVLYSGEGEGADLVGRAEAGISVPAGDAHALAVAARRLATHPELADAMGRRGRAFVTNHHSWATTVRDWLVQLTDHLAAPQ